MNTSFQPRPKSKTAINDVTGKEIATHYNNNAYVNGWDLIWGDKNKNTSSKPYGLTIEEPIVPQEFPNKEPYDEHNFNPRTMDHPTIHTNRFFE